MADADDDQFASGIAHFIWYGQSEWQGWQSAPPLTLAQKHDCLMLGASPRPRALASHTPGVGHYQPVGARFQPLVSVCQEVNTGKIVPPASGGLANIRGAIFGATPLTIDFGAASYQAHHHGEVIARDDLTQVFSPGQKIVFHAAGGGWAEARHHGVKAVTATRLTLGGPPPEGLPEVFEIHIVNSQIELLGEEPGVTALTHLRGLQLAQGSAAGPPLLSNACIGGSSVATLSKDARSGIYARVPEVVGQVHAKSDRRGTVHAIVFGQGGTDCQERTKRADYAARLTQLAADLTADIVAITGQAKPPLFLIFQVSGGNLSGDDRCAVPMAQLDLALAPPVPGFAMIGPFYAVPDQKLPFHGIHWTGNGARWAGQITGKILHKILDRGETWLPLHPTRLTAWGDVVLIDYHVPEPPLQFRPAYCGTTPVMWPDRGFEVRDEAGAVEILAVEIVGAGRVRITCARSLGGGAVVHYGGVKHRGGGNLCDSDPAVASDNYLYTRFGGQAPTEDIPELVGKPYPMWNWCVLFKIAALPDHQGIASPL